MKIFKNKKNPNQTLQSLQVGVFEVRLSISKIEIETNDKSWKQVYSSNTRPYLELVNLIAKNQTDLIHNLIYALYSTNLFFYNADFCREWINRSNEKAREMQVENNK